MQVLICDDSSFAQKQIARALPPDWRVSLSFARNGHEALAALRQGKGQVLFLDLNMPDLDGYKVLETIRHERIDSAVIVVSGDVQPEAQRRVEQLGALGFVKKPADPAVLASLLGRLGILDGSRFAGLGDPAHSALWDGYREIANVALGRAVSLIAQLLDVFVLMPIPNVNILEKSELQMALSSVRNTEEEDVSAVCQGFAGGGITGEALLIFNDSSFRDIAQLMHFEGVVDSNAQVELLMDMASILIGACLKGIEEQLDVKFSQAHPVVLGRHVAVSDLIERNMAHGKPTLTIEMALQFEGRKVSCDLLLLLTEESMPRLNDIVSYLMAP
ncbi:response regulator [Thioalkalivibrio sulfidiphilus]|uniref:response regulator n=1 Tax=Thioalkalivibrio sulfidiphilus TaxID=1033854 RepID=UPI003B2D049C